MKKTLNKNPSDPINFIRIQCKIPQTLNFNSYNTGQLNFET
jgi:hypothetical protein